jgi:hypothetical protein
LAKKEGKVSLGGDEMGDVLESSGQEERSTGGRRKSIRRRNFGTKWMPLLQIVTRLENTITARNLLLAGGP